KPIAAIRTALDLERLNRALRLQRLQRETSVRSDRLHARALVYPAQHRLVACSVVAEAVAHSGDAVAVFVDRSCDSGSAQGFGAERASVGVIESQAMTGFVRRLPNAVIGIHHRVRDQP